MKVKNPSQGIPQHIRDWMLQLGYVHDSEVEGATSTAPRTRARWKPLRPVYFGKEAWYQLSDIKRHLDERAAINEQNDELVSL
jgi:hypothetical protein